MAVLTLHSASQAREPASIYLIESDNDAIHLSDHPQGRPARMVIDSVRAVQPVASGNAAALPQSSAATARPVDAALTQIVRQAADANALDPKLVHAVIAAESGYALRAVSPRGAQGLMQLMPATARQYGVTDPFDARQNVRAGTLHLRQLLDQFGQDTVLALAAYNAGAAAVARHGHAVPPFAETTHYIQRVLRRYDALRGPAFTTTARRAS